MRDISKTRWGYVVMKKSWAFNNIKSWVGCLYLDRYVG